MKRLPDDIFAIRNMAEAASMEGDFATTARLYRELIDKGKAEAGDFNNAAWNAMVMGPVDTRALDDARRAVLLTKEKEHAVLHTLATLYAEAGQTTQARETLFKALDAGNIDEPGPEDWYVLGRIAEQYGEKDAAADAYRRVTVSPDISSAGSCYALAQKRLLGMTGTSRARSEK